MGNDRLGGWWLAGGGGLLAGLALPPLGWPPLLWLAWAGLWALPGSAIGARGGVLWGGAAVLVSHRWLLGLHPLDWIGVPGPLSLPLAAGLDPDNLPESDPSKMQFGSGGSGKSKAWRDIWGCGQGIGTLHDIPTAGELVARLTRQYDAARARLGLAVQQREAA